ncbi:epididymal secretory protein E1-like protein [Leptotrombidium deliense]|uniref:Epididymal secretory protein E1-like protein n=1 Tax=Leptotrombidium deliense TaxID=299467 RepID=A0A443RWY3_9ACAR|nr:epididymal secretory protein E1-like protein [Leptotrombidium deliense]
MLLLLLLFTLAKATPFTKCDNNSSVQSVDVEGCPDGSEWCELTQGKKYRVTINFVSNADSNTLTATGSATGHGGQIALIGLDSNACDDNNIQCPIKKGQSYSYSLTVIIYHGYPLLESTVTFRLHDDKNNDVICGKLPVKVVTVLTCKLCLGKNLF